MLTFRRNSRLDLLLRTNRSRVAGVTLVELLVGIVVALIVLLAVLGIYLATVRASTDTMQSVRLNQDLRAAMMVITSDLRRAGYWNQAAIAANPFRLQDTLGFRIPPGTTGCVRFEYDRNQDGFIGPEEYFGFWLDGGQIRMLSVPDPTSVLTTFNECSANVVTAPDGWNVLAGDDGLSITEFQLDEVFLCRNATEGGALEPCADVFADATAGVDFIVQVRQVDIALEGQLGPHSMRIEESVRLRNDRRFRYDGP